MLKTRVHYYYYVMDILKARICAVRSQLENCPNMAVNMAKPCGTFGRIMAGLSRTVPQIR